MSKGFTHSSTMAESNCRTRVIGIQLAFESLPNEGQPGSNPKVRVADDPEVTQLPLRISRRVSHFHIAAVHFAQGYDPLAVGRTAQPRTTKMECSTAESRAVFNRRFFRSLLERLTRRSPVHHHCLSRRDGSRPCVVAKLDGVPSGRQGDGLIDLFGRKLRARTVEHSVVIRAGGLHGQGS